MLKLDYEALAVEAGKLRTEGETFETCISKMSTVVSGLPDIWEAETCEQYVTQYETAKKTLDDVRELIEAMAAQMEKISENFAKADTDMKNQMQ